MGFVERVASVLGISKHYDDDYYEEEAEGTYGGSYSDYESGGSYDDPSSRYSSGSSRSSSSRSSSSRSSSGGYDSYDTHSDYTTGSRSSSRYGNTSSSGYSSSSYDRTQGSGRSSSQGSSSSYRSSGSSYSSGYHKGSYDRGTQSYSSKNYSAGSNSMRNSKVVSLNTNVQMEVVVVNPETLEDARDIAMQIKERKPVVVNLEFADPRTAQRITDLICGCSYALNGNIQRVSDKIFMVAPETIGFAGDLDIREKLQSEASLLFPWQEL